MDERPKPIVKLSDLLSDKDKAKVKEWEEKRLRPKFETEIPPELYIIGEAIYYGGWEAFRDIKRGYIDGKDVTGEEIRIPLTLEEVISIIKACDKVWYKKLVETGDITISANIASQSQRPAESFNRNAKEFIRKATN